MSGVSQCRPAVRGCAPTAPPLRAPTPRSCARHARPRGSGACQCASPTPLRRLLPPLTLLVAGGAWVARAIRCGPTRGGGVATPCPLSHPRRADRTRLRPLPRGAPVRDREGRGGDRDARVRPHRALRQDGHPHRRARRGARHRRAERRCARRAAAARGLRRPPLRACARRGARAGCREAGVPSPPRTDVHEQPGPGHRRHGVRRRRVAVAVPPSCAPRGTRRPRSRQR